MTDIQLAADTTSTQQASPVVWILSKGILQEGGDIIDVYLDRELALGDFLTHAAQIAQGNGKIYNPRASDDGALHLSGMSEWLALEPHTVRTKRSLGA
ncbi:hypothetical protein [Streptomyces cylindrosporus]|uniref:Uncharacterized protein n=1 Tax=Streptomyces cylindrosporus TaxID=2927583 RepID=A0ABS9YSB4_9ACTN|nr:hypothetical protein [Streptomyces cylindrosporus]MCI3279136.1 hypothetical protein [Streptomyces cylindrosporus]